MTFKFKCPECKHEFVVGFWKWLFAPKLFDVSRYMKCPACKKRSWMADKTFVKE